MQQRGSFFLRRERWAAQIVEGVAHSAPPPLSSLVLQLVGPVLTSNGAWGEGEERDGNNNGAELTSGIVEHSVVSGHGLRK